MSIRRAFILGLDGATWTLLEPWAREGHLPNLLAVLEGGAWRELRSTIPAHTAPAWSSFYTGVNPGAHGIFDFLRRLPGSYATAPVSSHDRVAPTIFRLLSDAGIPVVAVNAPLTYPPEPVNGFLVAGIPMPAQCDDFTYPAELAAELRQTIRGYTPWPTDARHALADPESYLAGVLEYVRIARDVTFSLWERAPNWVLFMTHLQVTDTIQHAFWATIDPGHPQHQRDTSPAARGGILACFRAVDAFLGELRARLGPQDLLLIASDHGHGPVHEYIHTNTWLLERGWLQLRRTPWTRLRVLLFRAGFSPDSLYSLALQLGLGRAARAASRRVSRDRLIRFVDRLVLSEDDIDWERSRAFATSSNAGIWLNLLGREPRGCVPPEEYQRTLDELEAELRSARHPRSGEPVVGEVYQRDKIYCGLQVGSLPDLVFTGAPGRYHPFGEAEFRFSARHWLAPSYIGTTGTHTPLGVLAVAGDGVRAAGRLEPASIEDVAPTLLAALGEPIPGHVEGQVLQEMFVEPLAVRRAEGGERQKGPAAAASAYSPEEEEHVRRRLAELGYLE